MVELIDLLYPFGFAFGNLIEISFFIRGEVIIQYFGELLNEEVVGRIA